MDVKIILKFHLQQKHAKIFHQAFKLSSFKIIENQHDVYRGSDRVKEFCIL